MVCKQAIEEGLSFQSLGIRPDSLSGTAAGAVAPARIQGGEAGRRTRLWGGMTSSDGLQGRSFGPFVTLGAHAFESQAIILDFPRSSQGYPAP